MSGVGNRGSESRTENLRGVFGLGSEKQSDEKERGRERGKKMMCEEIKQEGETLPCIMYDHDVLLLAVE